MCGYDCTNNIQVSLGCRDESAELLLVLRTDVLDRKDSCSLLVHDSAEASLVLHNNVGDTHLTAESRDENDKFNRVNVISDDNEAGLLSLNESNTVVQTVLDEERRLLGLLLFVFRSRLRFSLKTGLLLLLALRAILVQELKELCCGVLVEGVGELGDGRGYLEALVKDDLLALKTDICGPLDEASQVLGGLDILALNDESGTTEEQDGTEGRGESSQLNHSPIPKFLGVASKRGFWVFF